MLLSQRILMLLTVILLSANMKPAEAVGSNVDLPDTVNELRSYLDVINFELKGAEQLSLLEALVPHTEELAQQFPDDAGFSMMAGFFNAQYAGAKGGLGALKFAKKARDYLQSSSDLDPGLYGAGALCVLGSLYYKIPGWPLGFGDKKKARRLLEKALELSPNGIDANITYARYLFDEKQFELARDYFRRAENAPRRPDRPRADEEILKEIEKRLKEIKEKLG